MGDLTDFADICAEDPADAGTVIFTTILSFIPCSIITYIAIFAIVHLRRNAEKSHLHKRIYSLSIFSIIALTFAAWCQLFSLLICQVGFEIVRDLSSTTNVWLLCLAIEITLFGYHYGAISLSVIFLYRLYLTFKDKAVRKFAYSLKLYKIFFVVTMFDLVFFTLGIVLFLFDGVIGFLVTGFANIIYCVMCVVIMICFTRALSKVKLILIQLFFHIYGIQFFEIVNVSFCFVLIIRIKCKIDHPVDTKQLVFFGMFFPIPSLNSQSQPCNRYLFIFWDLEFLLRGFFWFFLVFCGFLVLFYLFSHYRVLVVACFRFVIPQLYRLQ